MQEEIQTSIIEDDNKPQLTLEGLQAEVIILKQIIKDYKDEVIMLRRELNALKVETLKPTPTVWKRNTNGIIEAFSPKENK